MGQRIFHAFNNTPMGYALPGALGAALALGGAKRVVCIVGDGSLMMNLQEMATISHHALPVKLFLIDNEGYAMVQQTQEQWLGGKYHATSKEGGLSFPDYEGLAKSFGFAWQDISENGAIEAGIEATLASSGPSFCALRISRLHRVVPQSKFGRPIEDSEPLLPRDEFFANMIAKPMPASLEMDS
jgi:acetolactate synthase I/II/III large subunit